MYLFTQHGRTRSGKCRYLAPPSVKYRNQLIHPGCEISFYQPYPVPAIDKSCTIVQCACILNITAFRGYQSSYFKKSDTQVTL